MIAPQRLETEMYPRKLSLIDAVIHGDTEAVRTLLAAGSDVNETANGGRTPLILAILFRRTQIMTLLLEAGADPHQRDSLGLNAVDWADRKGLKLLNQGQARKQETAPVTPSKEPIPLGGLAPSQSEKQTSRPSGASTQSASDDEKSRRWLAGFKRRIDEEASHKIKEVEPTRPPTTEVEATPENGPPHTLVNKSLVEVSAHKPERAVISAPVERLPNFHRKRCPKCNTVYSSELVAYCAIDETPLVDASQPLFASFTSPPQTAGMPLVWLLVVFVLFFIVGAAVTYFMIPYQ